MVRKEERIRKTGKEKKERWEIWREQRRRRGKKVDIGENMDELAKEGEKRETEKVYDVEESLDE